jgi:membrane protease YdiL (CAAX protease family)
VEPTTDKGANPPFIGGGDRLQQRPVLSSILIAILAGLLLRMARIVEFSDLVDSLLPDHYIGARLIDFGFRMTMGALLVLVAIPLLLRYYRTGWLRDYLRHMRLSMGTQPRRTLEVALLSFLAFVGLLIAFSIGAGVFSFDPSVLIDDNNWLILLAALVPGIWEELAFRGVVLANLQRRFSPGRAVIVSSVVFGLFHFSNLGSWDDLASVVSGVIAATALGIGWGYVVIKTNSVVPSIFLHYVVDVVLFDELFIDPLAGDDSTAIVYVGVVVLYPLLTILLTRLLFKNKPVIVWKH